MFRLIFCIEVDEKPKLEVPIGEVEGRPLAKVVDYCKYHHVAGRSPSDIERWETDFVNVDKPALFQLILVRHAFCCLFARRGPVFELSFRVCKTDSWPFVWLGHSSHGIRRRQTFLTLKVWLTWGVRR